MPTLRDCGEIAAEGSLFATVYRGKDLLAQRIDGCKSRPQRDKRSTNNNPFRNRSARHVGCKILATTWFTQPCNESP